MLEEEDERVYVVEEVGGMVSLEKSEEWTYELEWK